jgi:hypothetical protein
MSQTSETRGEKRIVQPPVTDGSVGASSVLSVALAEDEEVNWLWTHLPDGRSFVSGYEVIKKGGEKTTFNLEGAVNDWLQLGEKKAGGGK